MKTLRFNLFGLAATLLLGLTTIASAQMMTTQSGGDEAERQRTREAQRAMMRSPAMRQMQANTIKQQMNSFWNGNGSNLMAIGLLQQNDDFREGIGVSKEQNQKMQETMQNTLMNMQDSPELKPLVDELTKLVSGSLEENISEETQKKALDLQAKMQDIIFKKMTNLVDETLTSDQMKKVREFQVSAMSEIPIVSPNMFEALDLSGVQKKQFDGIKKEMEPEFEKYMDRMVDVQLKLSDRLMDEFENLNLESVTNPEERKRIMDDIMKKVRESNPDLHREMNEMVESNKEFVNKLKFRMFDVLTDEQWDRLQDLVDNPPDYVKKIIAQIRKAMGNDDSQANSVWNAWKPGDAIPEEYRQKRQTSGRGFPRQENKRHNEP